MAGKTGGGSFGAPHRKILSNNPDVAFGLQR